MTDAIQKKFEDALEQLKWDVDWSETDGSDVEEILLCHLGSKKTMQDNKDLFLDILQNRKDMNLFQKAFVRMKITGSKKLEY